MLPHAIPKDHNGEIVSSSSAASSSQFVRVGVQSFFATLHTYAGHRYMRFTYSLAGPGDELLDDVRRLTVHGACPGIGRAAALGLGPRYRPGTPWPSNIESAEYADLPNSAGFIC
jgi:hypothetical protein